MDAPHAYRHKGNLYAVRLDIRSPNEQLVVGGQPRHDHAHEDVYVAIRDAFDACSAHPETVARLRAHVAWLEQQAEQIRGSLRTMAGLVEPEPLVDA